MVFLQSPGLAGVRSGEPLTRYIDIIANKSKGQGVA
jgi:hypothetical protein